MALKPPGSPLRDARIAEMAALQAQLDAAVKAHRAGKLDEAERGYGKILERAPNHPDALNLMGVVQAERNRSEMAVELLTRAARLQPKDAAILNNLGRACVRARRLEEGIEALETAVALEPGLSEAYRNLITAHRLSGNIAEARYFISALRRSAQDNPSAAYEEARLLADHGMKAEARIVLERIAAEYPGEGQAWYHLAELDKVRADDPFLAQVFDRIRNAKEPSSQLKWLCYAAGKALDDVGEYDEAFAQFARAKVQEPPTYDASRTEAFYVSTKKTFDKAFFAARKDFGVPDERPIFIVGMPRSGTTLAEQVLASHRDVFGGGELEHIGFAMAHLGSLSRKNLQFPEVAAHITANAAAAVAFRYLRRLNNLDRTRPRVTDKMPHNFRSLGLIAICLPRAKVVHCIRDPRDTLLSCFMHEFRSAHSYNQSLEGLAHHYNYYRKLMEHWEEVLPVQPFALSYEEMVQNPRQVTESMLRNLGLEWDEDTMDFHRTNRRVSTPSNWQVRSPIYSSSTQRWRNYERHLGPLIDALDKRYLPD